MAADGAAPDLRATAGSDRVTGEVSATVRIEQGTPVEAFRLASRIAEFGGEAERYGLDVYRQRLAGTHALVLIAFVAGQAVGFKAGYDRFRDGSWYSWMGGVLAPWRGQGIAQHLLEAQEDWVRRAGYRVLYVKTRNHHKRMIAFLAMNGYDILRVEEKSSVDESRILFCKALA